MFVTLRNANALERANLIVAPQKCWRG